MLLPLRALIELFLVVASASTDLVVLTTDEVLVVSSQSWTVRERIALPSPYIAEEWPSRRMALLTDSTIAVLGRREVVVVGIDPLRSIARFPLPQGTYRSLAVVSNRKSITVCGNDHHDAVILNVQTDRMDAHEVARIPGTATMDWDIYQCAWSNDARRLYVSYHGQRTTGIDWFTIDGDSLKRCAGRRRPNVGCIAAHGGFVIRDQYVFAATGGAQVLQFSLNGDSIGIINTGIRGHLMEFAVDTGQDNLYAVAPCGYSSGFSRTRLAPTPSTSLIRTRLCSGQITVIGPHVASLAPGSSYVHIINAETGRREARAYVGAAALDVLRP